MKLDPVTMSKLKSFTHHGMKEEDVVEMARAVQGVVLKIQAAQGVDREQAIKVLVDTIGEASQDDLFKLLRLPGDIGTKDI